MSQVTKVNPRCPVSKWASAEDRAGHGPIHDVSQARSRTRVCVCTGAMGRGRRWGPRVRLLSTVKLHLGPWHTETLGSFRVTFAELDYDTKILNN